MKKFILIFTISFLAVNAYAKKDIGAWKKEDKLEKQFSVFKQNLNLWDGYLFFKPFQIDELFSAVNDTISNLEVNISEKQTKITELESNIVNLNTSLTSTQTKLDDSLKREDSFNTLGIDISKGSFATMMYALTLLLVIGVGVLFFLFKQSHKITKEAKEKFEDLDKEFDMHKKNNLERFTKLNRELHDAKMKLGEL